MKIVRRFCACGCGALKDWRPGLSAYIKNHQKRKRSEVIPFGDFFRVELSQGAWAVVDDSSVPLVRQYKWFLSHGYAARNRLDDEPVGPRLIMMHRVVLCAPDGLEVDHVNGDRLDNRLANLRVATAAENRRNRHHRSGSSRYKGVCWDKNRGKWKASISVDDRTVNLGRFDREIDAAVAYDRAALESFGEFANTNGVIR